MKKYLLLLAVAGLMSSCYDLDQYPHDKLSSGTFWKTEEHAHQGMMAIYAQMKNENTFNCYFRGDGLSEIGWDDTAMSAINMGTYTNSNGTVSNRWSSLYEGVARANLFLQNIDGVEIAEEQKAQYKGEAKFMRALYYFQLLDFFGGVPLYDETTIVSDDFMNMKKSRSSADEIRQFILDDLTEAVNVLPVSWGTSEYGRATRGAAVALRGKVKLYAKDYTGAASDFEEIVKDPNGRGYNYKLYDSYPDLFKPIGDSSDEMIFTIQASAGVGNDNGLPTGLYMGSRSSFGGGWNNCIPTDILVDMYEEKDGKPFSWENYIPGFTTSKEIQKETFEAVLVNNVVSEYPEKKDFVREIYENRDPRLEQTILTPYAHILGAVGRTPKEMEFVLAKGTNENYGYIRNNRGWYDYLWRKFVPEGDMDGEINDRYHVPINFPIIRYADVLLMLAECYNENGDQSGAVALINQIRQRPSTNMPAINNGDAWMKATTKEEVFQRIVHERAVELAAEGHRFSDLKRWGLCEEKLNFTYDDILGNDRYTRKFVERDYLWPIPLTELERNPDLKSQQNPGW